MMGSAKGCAVLLLLGLSAATAMAAPPLEEETINPSEIVFQGDKPYSSIDGELQPVKTRSINGEVVYYRLVRYDAENGYVSSDGGRSMEGVGFVTNHDNPLTPMRYHGAGLSRPDFYNSPYNRDARQRYSGPGYFGSCSRYDGCREVQVVPLYPYPYRYAY